MHQSDIWLDRRLAERFPDGLPPEVAALGHPTAEYGAGMLRRLANLVFGLVLLPLGPYLFYATGYFLLTNPNREQGMQLAWRLVIGLTLGLIFLTWSFYLLWKVFKRSQSWVFLFEQGILQIDGTTIAAMRWDEIETVKEGKSEEAPTVDGAPMWFPYHCILTDHQGRKLEFSQAIPGIEKLADRIQTEVVRLQLPRVIQRLNAGEVIHFGKAVSVSPEGVAVLDQRLSWDEVASIGISRMAPMAQPGTQFIEIRKKGKWLCWERLMYSMVPNGRLFLAIVDHMKK